MPEGLLFSGVSIFQVVEGQLAQAKAALFRLATPDLLNSDESQLIASLVEEFQIDVPILDVSAKSATHEEVDFDLRRAAPGTYFLRGSSGPTFVKGTRIELTIPFTGDAALFQVQPSTHTSNPPTGMVMDGALVLIHEARLIDAQQMEQRFDRTIREITEHLEYLRPSADSLRKSLESLIAGEIEKRKAKVKTDSESLGKLSMPIRRKGTAPATYRVPLSRRPAPVRPASATASAPTTPEPVFPDEEYRHILSVFSNMVLVMEQSPKAFSHMGEEDLRTHFLVQLNAQYHGNATGETFNYSGKTDILLRVDGKNIFVAECKFWSGEKAFLTTIDQLLSYLQWRDNRAAVLLFNRNKGFSEVLATIENSIPKHPNFVRSNPKSAETVFPCVFRQKQDADRIVTLTIMAFDVPSPH